MKSILILLVGLSLYGQTTINTKSGAGQLQVEHHFTNSPPSNGRGFNTLLLGETFCGANLDESTLIGNEVIGIVSAAVADDTCTRTMINGLNSIVRSEKAGAGAFPPGYGGRSFEADVSWNSADAVFMGGISSAAGDLNVTGILSNSTGNKHGGVGIWVTADPIAAWQRGIVVDGYNHFGIHVIGDGNHLVLDGNKHASILFQGGGADRFRLGKTPAHQFALFDEANSTTAWLYDPASHTTTFGKVAAFTYESTAAGYFLIRAKTATVKASEVTPKSQILLTRDDSIGKECNTATTMGEIRISTRQPSNSFTVSVQNAPIGKPYCVSYSIVN